MRKKIEFEWEQIDWTDPGTITMRAKVIGGWLVCNWTNKSGGTKNFSQSQSMTFVPDRDHEWHVLPSVKQETPPSKPTVKAEDFEAPTRGTVRAKVD